MITQCPSCGTLFRVTPEQLRAHQGKVRCGSCMAVFDGLKALVASPAPAQETAAGSVDEGAGFRLEPVEPAQPPAARAAEAETMDKDYGPAPEQLSLDAQLYSAESRRGARGWAVGVVLLVFVLAGQAAYFYRTDLATRYPGLKPHLVQLCQALRCSVLPPQVAPDAEARRKQISIEASDLQVADAGRPGVIRLTATLRNHAGHDLGYPALDLVLTNTKEHALARRIFAPQEYLERGKDVTKGIPASAEITIRLDLDTGELNPAGFRLDLLPAPAQ